MSESTEYLTEEEPDVRSLARRVATVEHGAVCTFVGTARRTSGDREVVELRYEAYAPMAEAGLEAIVREAQSRFRGARVAVQHRLGVCPLGEASVAIAVGSPHRGEAFGACRYVIDELKRRVPIWKQEVYSDGTQWVGEDGAPPPPAGPEGRAR